MQFTYQLAGETAVVDVPDDLAAYYSAQPGYTKLVSPEEALAAVEAAQAAAERLKGAKLNERARELGISTNLTADEKRQAIAEAESVQVAVESAPPAGQPASASDQAVPVVGSVEPVSSSIFPPDPESPDAQPGPDNTEQ